MTPARIPLVLVSAAAHRTTDCSTTVSQGAGQVGSQGRITDPTEVQKWIDLMVAHGQVGVDTARVYSEGTAEKVRASPYSSA